MEVWGDAKFVGDNADEVVFRMVDLLASCNVPQGRQYGILAVPLGVHAAQFNYGTTLGLRVHDGDFGVRFKFEPMLKRLSREILLRAAKHRRGRVIDVAHGAIFATYDDGIGY